MSQTTNIAVTRTQNVARAQELRAAGLSVRQIAGRMNVGRSTVSMWLSDPDLSKQRARRAGYQGRCVECGGPTDGSNGPDRAPSRCLSCIAWTDEQIIDAIRRWADDHGGRSPREADWYLATADHPSGDTVVVRLGWNNALLAAGLGLHQDKRPETQAWIVRELQAGTPTREIADRLGVTTEAIHRRLGYRGLRVSEIRAGRGARP